VTIDSGKKSNRKNYPSGSKWEELVGYSRAVRVGKVIEVAGTTATDEHGKVFAPGDPYLQTQFILKKIETYLHKAGASMGHVVRTRMFVTDIGCWQEVGKAHGEFFRPVKPAASMVEVRRLIEPELLVEIEVTAIID
jgi:enamine deaminase RidA (YjgF/YER057c/UK114 family)